MDEILNLIESVPEGFPSYFFSEVLISELNYYYYYYICKTNTQTIIGFVKNDVYVTVKLFFSVYFV